MKRKLCSVLLALCMVLTLLPVSAMAEVDDNTAPASTNVSLPSGNSGNFTISTEGATLDGNGATYSNGTITVNAANVTITNLTFGDMASLVVNTTGKFTLTGCKFEPNTEYVKNSSQGVRTAAYLKVGEAEVTNNIFDGVTNGYYNAIEFGISADNDLSKATISGNTFNKAIKNNYFNFYNMTNNAQIDIVGNHFLLAEKTSNGIRISNPRNANNIIFNIANNEYTYATASADSVYEGLILLQDYATGDNVQDFTKITLNVTNLKAPQDAKQFLYVYDDQAGIINTNQPKLTGDDASLSQFYAAKIDDTYYKTLADAYAALPRGTGAAPAEATTITLLKDCAGGGMGVDKTDKYMNYVIDFGGHTYTVGAPSVGSTGTVSQGLRVLQDSTAKFMNGTLKAADYKALIQVVHTYGDVTFQDFTVDATEDSHAWAAVEPDAGTLNILGNSSILAREGNYGLYTAFWHTGSYNGTTVNIDTTGKITGMLAYEFDEDETGADKASENKGFVNIQNGNFDVTSIEEIWSDVSESVDKTVGGFSLTGGTYSVDPTAYVASGAIARKDSDTKFVVVEKANLTSGVYTSDPSSALAPGYVSYKNSDNSTYTVYYPVPVTPGNTSSSTTKNPDGSTTTTTTDKTTGTVTETTKNPDGSTTTVETKKDGSVTETNKTAGGSVGTVKSDANGNSEISASISAADVSAAAKKNEPVAAPVSVAPAASPAAAPVIKLSVPASAGEVSVVIPVTNAQQGTVAIKVNPDGTEEIIKTSVVTKDGVVLGVKGSTQIKIVNNDKDFSDTVGHWAESDVDFVSARELFTGTAPQTFSPEAATTRGMVVTVLARLAGESTDGGANWYDKGCAWAVTNGVSDGTDPNGTVTREQLAAMLYRYFGSPAVSGSLSFADASSVSEYAHDAMQWCVNNGIINGMDGLLNPQGQATRAQVSAMFARYIRLMSTK